MIRMLILFIAAAAATAQSEVPAPLGDGYLLPTGWKITPAGKHVPAKDTVLNLKTSPDGKWVAALSTGYNAHMVMLLDTASGTVAQEVPIRAAWMGLAWAPDGKTLFVSGGNRKNPRADAAPVYAIPFDGAKLDRQAVKEFKDTQPREKTFWTGLVAHPSGGVLYACNRLAGEVVGFDTATGEVKARTKVELDPYGLAISSDGATLYCTNWGSDSLSIIDTAAQKVVATIAAGDNPNDVIPISEGRVAVCSANDNTVLLLDAKEQRFTERIATTMHPMAPEGATPNALAFDAKTNRLFVANATNNNVCVINLDEPGESSVAGFIPAGWYPAALALAQDGRDLYMGNAKGIASFADPQGPKRPKKADDLREESIKKLLVGDVSIVDLGKGDFAAWTKRCMENSPYNDTLLSHAKPPSAPSVVPSKVGVGSPIKHVLYIIKENRTYDQVLGDMKEGNGDPALCLFGEVVTPNHHAMARQFVLLDNLYCEAEVSANGHQWSNAAYATDFVEKNWPASYGDKAEAIKSPAMIPGAGYLWNQAAEKGLTFRNYGEFGRRQSDGDSVVADDNLPVGLHGHMAPKFGAWGKRDPENAKEFIAEFEEFEKYYESKDPKKRLPNLMVMSLPEDHTRGTRPGSPTPRAAVASNDYALGLIVDRITHSKYWPETAIFVIEDDAQDGSDHVDARRTIGQLISPYTRRGMVDHTMYSTCAMLRTIELLLGFRPMSQFDAAATPMYACMGDTPDLSTYTCLPARIDLNEMNGADAPGAKISLQMDFSDFDRAPMFALNEVVWKSVKGSDSEMPLPVHRFIVR